MLRRIFLLVSAISVAAAGRATAQGNFLDNLDTYNTSLFQKADGWTNGGPFNNGWRADHVNFAGGIMTLTLDNASCPAGCSNMPYASGEYRTNAQYGYGRVEARFRAARGSGIMAASLFTYTGSPWDEIDVEILGKNTTQMQTNYFTNGVGGKETIINLGFDAAAGFHNYAFEWSASAIRWYVDGVLVHTETGSKGPLPTHPGQIMVNIWPGIGVDGWLGPFSYPGPLNAQYDWIRFTAAGSATATPTAAATGTFTPTATSAASATATATTAATPTPPPSGGISTTAWYQVVNLNSGRCVDARAAGTANGTAVQQHACNNTFAQHWQFLATDSGHYRVVNRNVVTRVWDVAGAANGAPIQLWDFSGGTHQQWLPEDVGGGYYRFRARHSGRCLDVPAASLLDGVQLQQTDCNGNAAQSFRLDVR